MIFSSFPYLFFFLTILALMRLLPSDRLKKAVLLAGSYVFYAFWDYRFVALLALSTLVNYAVGQRIERNDGEERRKWLIRGIAFNLVVLGVFKYFNFFIENANALLRPMHFGIPFLRIILPIGISFITFEVISYLVDIYRRESRSAGSVAELGLLVAFFPHLIAGPILKPMQFLPEIEKPIRIEWSNIEYGVQIFLLGLVKKMLISDRVAPFVDRVFHAPAQFSSHTVWLAVIAYAIQIFCDFSGYSDMAIGSARCLGFYIPANFNLPYLSQNVTEFWRRWHISLSSWLREYLYIPLGGNRKGKARQYFNLLIVMLLGGLWHGAHWNFVFWGGLHGLGLAVHKLYTDTFWTNERQSGPVLRAVNWLITAVFICVTWVFFRAASFPQAVLILRKMFWLTLPVGTEWMQTSTLVALPFLVLAHALGSRFGATYRLRLTTFAGMFVLFFVLLGLIFLAPTSSSPFIYFQF